MADNTIKNTYQKLQDARQMLKGMDIKKSGISAMNKNKGYFVLEDIQPPITEVCSGVGLCPVFSFTEKEAVLSIYNTQDAAAAPLVFTSPMTALKINSMSEIQSLGAIETYHRRYLYCIAFDIVDKQDSDGADDTAYHDIWKIKSRCETKLTNAMKTGKDKTEISKMLGISEKQLEQYLAMFGQIGAFEKRLDAIAQ